MELDCGIRSERIVEWLDGELELSRESDCWIFVHDGQRCRVAVSPLGKRSYGNIELDRSQLSASGDQIALDEFYRLFTLRFISAGG